MIVGAVQPIRHFHQTDYGNAERLVARSGSDLHYVSSWKKWLVWDGCRWAVDETDEITRRAKSTVRAIYTEAGEAQSPEMREALAKHAVRSEASARVAAMISLAESEPGIPITHRVLDQDPWLLACANGTLDLRTGTLRPHCRDDLITKMAPVPYDAAAECPRWLAFLERIMAGRQDVIQFLQRAVGYSLTGSTSEQCLFFLHGPGANGKSTLLEVVRTLAGDYAQQADFATFLDKKVGDGPRNDIARMVGVRVVTSSEVGEGKRLNESLVKTLTGGDTVAARFLYTETFEFRPAFKLWLGANHRPVIRGTDDAIWRRVRLVPFTVQIPEAERDPQLADALRAELPGILRWAVDGCQLWLEDGLRAPLDVVEATAEYRQESDALGAFLEECCRTGPEEFVKAGELYQAFVRWAEQYGEYRLSAQSFGRRLTDRGFGQERRGTSASTRQVYRTGLTLAVELPPQWAGTSQRPFWES